MVKSTSRRIKSISERPAGKAAPRKPAAPAKAPPKKPSAKAPAKSKWVFGFGNGKAEGGADMRNLLGGKGAGLAEMANLGLPVPPGFTITTAVCTHCYENGNAYPKNLQEQVRAALAQVGRITGKTFGDGDNPLLVSVAPNFGFANGVVMSLSRPLPKPPVQRPQGLIFCQIGRFTIHDKAAHEQI
jgi:pyruvate,orthophosphate dikinase